MRIVGKRSAVALFSAMWRFLVSESCDDVFEGLRNRDPDVEAEIYCRYRVRLEWLAERFLSNSLLRKVGRSDVVQEAMISFFKLARAGRVIPGGGDSVWKLLARIVRFKCIRQAERYGNKKLNWHLELDIIDHPSETGGGFQPRSREESPAEFVALRDELDWLEKNTPAHYMRAIALELEGFGPAEIAIELQVSERTVKRAKQRVEKLLKERLGQQASRKS